MRGYIDRLYADPRSGGALQFASGYEGTGTGASTRGVDIVYRIDCTATNASTGSSNHIVAIYACTLNGKSCPLKL